MKKLYVKVVRPFFLPRKEQQGDHAVVVENLRQDVGAKLQVPEDLARELVANGKAEYCAPDEADARRKAA